MTEKFYTIRYVDGAIKDALRPREIEPKKSEVALIRDHLTMNLYPDLIDKEMFDSIIFSIYAVLVSGVQAERERTAGHLDKSIQD